MIACLGWKANNLLILSPLCMLCCRDMCLTSSAWSAADPNFMHNVDRLPGIEVTELEAGRVMDIETDEMLEASGGDILQLLLLLQCSG